MSLCVRLDRGEGPKVPGSLRAVTHPGGGRCRLVTARVSSQTSPSPTCRAVRGPWRVSLRGCLAHSSLASDAGQAQAVLGAVAVGTGRGQRLPPGTAV